MLHMDVDYYGRVWFLSSLAGESIYSEEKTRVYFTETMDRNRGTDTSSYSLRNFIPLQYDITREKIVL